MLATSALGFYSAHLAWRAIGGAMSDFLRAISSATVVAGVVWLVGLGVRHLVASTWGPLASIVVSLLLSGLAAVAVLWVLERALIQPVIDRLRVLRWRR
jgi:hypothetical protein